MPRLLGPPRYSPDEKREADDVGMRGRETFLAAGGEHLQLVPCLNSDTHWVEAVTSLVAVDK